jgi:hypothetical protein
MSHLDQGPKSGLVLSTPTPHLTVPADVVEAANRDLDALDDLLGPSPDDEPPPSTERREIAPVPRLGLRSDGAILLEVNSDVHEDDLKDREVIRYVTLKEDEASDALDRAQEGFSISAAKIVWQLARGRKGYPKTEAEPTEPTS